MNIEKIRDALEIGLNYVETSGWTRSREKETAEIKTALAELEKPGEGASELLEIVRNFQDGCDLEGVGFMIDDDNALSYINRYAASYHAKKCAECARVPPKCVLCGDPIIVGVCENCVPDIIKNG